MEKETREKIALKRYQIISPVLAEPARAQNEYFRTQAEGEHDFPHYGRRKIRVSTLKAWLRKYRQEGFDALKPQSRSDGGRPRRLTEQTIKVIEIKCKAYPNFSAQKLYEELRDQGLLGHPPVHYNTLLRVVKGQGWLSLKNRTDVRKAYEVDNVNDLWICDFLHGPQVRTGNHAKRVTKAILCAILDDHSRMVVGQTFSASETISTLTIVLKEAFLAYGIPKRLYVDNGPSFSSELLARSCALAGISLIHSKPYDSPSRGKIERFLRTVRERFLAGLKESLTLEELNQAFSLWLKDDYHHKIHTGIGEKPIDRYHASTSRVSIRRLSRAELDEIFLIRHERVVNNDATISFQGSLYEVPSAYIRQRIEIRHPVDDPEELYLYDNGVRVGRIKLLDKRENARTFRPQQVSTHLSFYKGRVQS
ncbi:MAG: DDE-type integrase/transposase/recombinase [Chloroflexi bacterium]|nr:DDE-type integrase/transposase/recombinase [Chloroflexota bacterium]